MDMGSKIKMRAVLGGALLLSFLAAPGLAFSRSPVDCRVELDRGTLPAGERQRAVVKVTLDALPPPDRSERPPVNLVIVLDRSGSMSGAKIQRAKEAAIHALRRLGPRDIFSLVIYDHIVETLVPARRAQNMEWIEGRIRGIQARGNTALFGGVSQGAAEARKNLHAEFVHRIILLSDGLANVGPSSPQDLGRLGASLIKENISVTTVGVGTDYNEDLMTRLSQNSDGNTYFVESSRDLPRIFAAELGDVLSVVAQKVVLTIECKEGVRPISIIGRQGRIVGRNAELYLNQLYGGQEKYALLEIEIPESEPNESREVAVARVSYMDAFSQKHRKASAVANARFSSSEREVRRSANVDVQRAFNLNLGAILQDKAVELADEGKNEQAVDALREASEKLKSAGEVYGDQVLIEKSHELEGQAAQIESEGMTKRSRKSLRTDSYQMRNQQMQK